MKEQLISFKTAKLAKEKGFIFPSCTGKLYYNLEGQITTQFDHLLNDDLIFCEAPTQSLLQKWLREVHDVQVFVIPVSHFQGDIKLTSYSFWCPAKDCSMKVSKDNYNTYEEALEEGLFEALKLIK